MFERATLQGQPALFPRLDCGMTQDTQRGEGADWAIMALIKSCSEQRLLTRNGFELFYCKHTFPFFPWVQTSHSLIWTSAVNRKKLKPIWLMERVKMDTEWTAWTLDFRCSWWKTLHLHMVESAQCGDWTEMFRKRKTLISIGYLLGMDFTWFTYDLSHVRFDHS